MLDQWPGCGEPQGRSELRGYREASKYGSRGGDRTGDTGDIRD